jgi:hypothetical protein
VVKDLVLSPVARGDLQVHRRGPTRLVDVDRDLAVRRTHEEVLLLFERIARDVGVRARYDLFDGERDDRGGAELAVDRSAIADHSFDHARGALSGLRWCEKTADHGHERARASRGDDGHRDDACERHEQARRRKSGIARAARDEVEQEHPGCARAREHGEDRRDRVVEANVSAAFEPDAHGELRGDRVPPLDEVHARDGEQAQRGHDHVGLPHHAVGPREATTRDRPWCHGR